MSIIFEKAAVLGASGPTGRDLARELKRRGLSVRAVSRRLAGLQRAFPEADIEKREGDALEQASLQSALEGCDLIIDCIGLPGDQMADHPRIARNIASSVGRSETRCLQVSSYWCFMPIVEVPVSESHPRRGGPAWARYRREAEDILRDAGAAIVHLPDFFGPHVHTSSLQLPIQDAVAGRPMNWIGGADVERDYIYVPDAMRIVVDLIGHPEAYGDDWAIAGSGPLSANSLAALLTEILKYDVKVRAAGPTLLRILSFFNKDLRGFMQMVPDYIKPTSYDGSRVESLLGKVSPTPYKQALSETVEWLKSSA